MGLFKKDIPSLTDEKLMKLLSGSQRNEALTELHKRYGKKALGFFIRIFQGDIDKAQDFVQDLFMKILEKHHLFDTSKSFSTWMFTIASNMSKTSFRSPTHISMEKLGEIKEGNWSESSFDKAMFTEQLERAIHKLPDYHRMTFQLRYIQNLALAEIAEITNCSTGTVKSRLYYATQKVTHDLKEFDPQGEQKLFKIS